MTHLLQNVLLARKENWSKMIIIIIVLLVVLIIVTLVPLKARAKLTIKFLKKHYALQITSFRF